MKVEIPFFKMHGLGNDYIYIDTTLLDNNLKYLIQRKKNEMAISMSKYHYGIGSDGLIIFWEKNKDFFIEMYNKNGSYSQICGNGFRCIGGYIYLKYGYSKFFIFSGKKKIYIKVKYDKNNQDTIHKKNLTDVNVLVNMGKSTCDIVDKGELNIDFYSWRYNCVDIGNPHCVIFLNDEDHLKQINLEDIVPKIRDVFGKKGMKDEMNFEFIKIESKDVFFQRTWERGSGETLACASGATAAFIVGRLLGILFNSVTSKLLGGDLYIFIQEDNIWQTGEINYPFEGVYLYDTKKDR